MTEIDPLERLRTDLRSERANTSGIGERVCRACVDALAVDGAGIMLVADDGHLSTMGVSGAMAARLEDLQFVLGEGPGVEAHSTGRPVWVPDLDGAPARWPAYGPAAAGEGVAAAFAFPLQVGAARLGALTVYRRIPGPLDPHQTSDAIELAAVAADALLWRQAAVAPGFALGATDFAGEFRARVHQAAGVISEQLDIAIGDALARLRAHAYASQRPIDDVARDLIARRLRIDRPSE